MTYSFGGGMYNYGGSPTIRNCIFSNNTAYDGGGGVYNEGSNATIIDTTFLGNATTRSGGGLYNDKGSNSTLTRVTFRNNTAGSAGGGMHNGTMSNPILTDVLFDGNSASVGGGMWSFNSTIFYTTILNRVMFSGNSASTKGGGLYIWDSNLTLTNVTFTGNTSDDKGAGIYIRGDVTYDYVATNLVHVTMQGNAAAGSGGGIYVFDESDAGVEPLLKIRNSILWGNTSATGNQVFVESANGNPISISDSIAQGGCPALANCANIITADPLFGALGDYGGFTRTIPLLPGSSAINTANDIYCPATDQRGVSRPQSIHCDIGSYEVEGLPIGWSGGAVVTSDRPVVSVGRPHVGTEVMTYNGFGSGSQTMYVPMLFKNAFGGSYNAALYVQNTDVLGSATVSVKYYDAGGSLTCAVNNVSIAPLAIQSYWLPSVGCLPVGWVGGAVITADKEIVAVGRPHIGSQVTSYGGFGAGNARMYVPMLFKGAFGGTYNAALYVQNTDSLDSATFSIDYYDSTGQLTCSVSGETLAPLASKGYWLPSVGCLPAGWVGGAMITADKDVVAIGRPHIGAQVTTYNGFSGGAASLRVPMLFKGAFGGSYNAALYVQNTDVSQDANIRINFYDTSGNLTCYVEDSLAAQASKGYWLPSVGCLPAGWVGGAVVTSDREIVSVGRPHVGAEVATYGGFMSGSTSLYLPMLFRNAFGGGYNAAFYVQNTDEVDAANVTFKLYDTAGNLSCLTSTSIPAGATVGYWLPNLTCTP
jgi:hypothetical protein